MKPPPVVGIAGWSGSGKTTLLTYLLARLAEQGLLVNVIKHSHHRLAQDTPDKDSARLRNAGAGNVLVCSSAQPWAMPDVGLATEAPLTDLINGLPPADLVLLEGFKKEPIPKLEIYRSKSGTPALYPHDPYVVAVASDTSSPAADTSRIWLDINQPAQIFAWLQIFMDSHVPGRSYGYTGTPVKAHDLM